MFNSLSQFYNSTEWRAFRQMLIAQRTNKEDGILYCEHSGKPLINSYDIVLHHVQHLTMQNVNDYSVSLNPDNIKIVSQRAHNEIHARFGYVTERKVYLVCGSPCSGKNTFVQENRGNSDIVVDIDAIWQSVNGGDKYRKPDALKKNVFALRDCLYDMIKTRTGKWEKAWVISAEPTESMRQRTAEKLGAEIIEIDTDKMTCLERLYSNPDGRDVELWRELIERYFEAR